MSNIRKILLGIYLAVMAVFCVQLGGKLLYVALVLALASILCVLNGFTEKEEKETNTEKTTKQE